MKPTQINRFVNKLNSSSLNNLLNAVSVQTNHLTQNSPTYSVIKSTIDPNEIIQSNYVESTQFEKSRDKEINLIEFTRLYKFGQIPIIDFIFVYIIIYLVNSIYLDLDYKIILVGAIPITIVINLLMNKKCKTTNIIILVLIMSMYYLLTCNYEQKN